MRNRKNVPKELPSLLKLLGNSINGIETLEYFSSECWSQDWWIGWAGYSEEALADIMLDTRHDYELDTSSYRLENWQWTMLGNDYPPLENYESSENSAKKFVRVPLFR